MGASCHSPCDLWELDARQVVPLGGGRPKMKKGIPPTNHVFFADTPPKISRADNEHLPRTRRSRPQRLNTFNITSVFKNTGKHHTRITSFSAIKGPRQGLQAGDPVGSTQLMFRETPARPPLFALRRCCEQVAKTSTESSILLSNEPKRVVDAETGCDA